jgi:carboxyl-terminal processing protease
MKKSALISFLVMSLFIVPAIAPAADTAADPPGGLSAVEKLYGLSSFWAMADNNFANFDLVPDLDWDAAYREAIPRILATKNTLDYYRELQRFCALLKDGHTNVYLPDSIVQNCFDYPFLLLGEIDHRAFIENLDSADAESLPVGSEITAVDGAPLHDYLKEKVFPYISASTEQALWDTGIYFNAFGFGLLAGSPGSTVELTAITPRGEHRTVKMVRNFRTVSVRHPFLPPPPFRLVEYEDIGNRTAYLALNSFGDPAVVDEFKALVPRLLEADGLIIDLRKNGGGSTGNSLPVAEFLASDTLLGSATRTRMQVAVKKAWAEHGLAEYSDYKGRGAWMYMAPDTIFPSAGPVFRKPVVILIGRNTASAAEDLLIYLDRVRNVTLVGEPSSGSTGQPLPLVLPGGGTARICAKRDYYPDGRDFVGSGVQPDVTVRKAPEDILSGRDRVRERGLEILKQKINECR